MVAVRLWLLYIEFKSCYFSGSTVINLCPPLNHCPDTFLPLCTSALLLNVLVLLTLQSHSSRSQAGTAPFCLGQTLIMSHRSTRAVPPFFIILPPVHKGQTKRCRKVIAEESLAEETLSLLTGGTPDCNQGKSLQSSLRALKTSGFTGGPAATLPES